MKFVGEVTDLVSVTGDYCSRCDQQEAARLLARKNFQDVDGA